MLCVSKGIAVSEAVTMLQKSIEAAKPKIVTPEPKPFVPGSDAESDEVVDMDAEN
jgi:hypothetical protein